MPPKRVCSDKEPLGKNKVRELPGVCFKKGIKAGFVAGIQTQKKREKKKMPIIEATAGAIAMSKFKSIAIEKATNDLRKAYLSQLGVSNYRNMSAERTIQELRQRGISRIIVPRK